jgi:hypothetical protein
MPVLGIQMPVMYTPMPVLGIQKSVIYDQNRINFRYFMVSGIKSAVNVAFHGVFAMYQPWSCFLTQIYHERAAKPIGALQAPCP